MTMKKSVGVLMTWYLQKQRENRKIVRNRKAFKQIISVSSILKISSARILHL